MGTLFIICICIYVIDVYCNIIVSQIFVIYKRGVLNENHFKTLDIQIQST